MAIAFTVPPFSGPRYGENASRCRGDQWPCAICGRATENASAWATVVDGGAAWGDESSDEEADGFMGQYPIGADCARRYRIRGIERALP